MNADPPTLRDQAIDAVGQALNDARYWLPVEGRPVAVDAVLALVGARALPDVQGRCPACRGQSLFLGDGGYVTCSRIDCPDPEAATRVLERRPDSCGSCGASPVTYYAPDGLPACAECAPCDCGTEPCSKPDSAALLKEASDA